MKTALSIFMDRNGVRPSRIADVMGVSRAQVSRWRAGANLTRKNIDALLSALSSELGEPVDYDDIFCAQERGAA